MITRTTNSQNNASLLDYISSTQSKINRLSQQISEGGKRILKISDDAVAAKGVFNTNKELNQIENYISNMSFASSEMSVLDSTLASGSSSLQRAYDIAMMAANGTYSENEMKAFKQEVDVIISSMQNVANTKFNDVYLFSGTKTQVQAFTKSDTGITYNGTPSDGAWQRKVLISDNTEEVINYTGDDLFGYAEVATDPTTGETTVSGDGIFGALYSLSNILDSGDIDATEMQTVMGNIQQGVDKLVDTRSSAGHKVARFNTMTSAMETSKINLTTFKSNLEDADITNLLTEWVQEQQSLEASYQVATQSMQSSLLNYI